MVVDRHGMVARNKLHAGVFGRDNLAHAADPDRAVQHADALHLEHELVLRKGGILGLEPIQALRRADLLDIEKNEEVLEMVVPFTHVRAYEGADGLRAPSVSTSPNKRRSISSLTDVPKKVEYKSFWRPDVRSGRVEQ